MLMFNIKEDLNKMSSIEEVCNYIIIVYRPLFILRAFENSTLQKDLQEYSKSLSEGDMELTYLKLEWFIIKNLIEDSIEDSSLLLFVDKYKNYEFDSMFYKDVKHILFKNDDILCLLDFQKGKEYTYANDCDDIDITKIFIDRISHFISNNNLVIDSDILNAYKKILSSEIYNNRSDIEVTTSYIINKIFANFYLLETYINANADLAVELINLEEINSSNLSKEARAIFDNINELSKGIINSTDTLKNKNKLITELIEIIFNYIISSCSEIIEN